MGSERNVRKLAEPILTPAQERLIAGAMGKLQDQLPKIRMLREMGRPDDELEARVQQLLQTCNAAIELNEAAKLGQLE